MKEKLIIKEMEEFSKKIEPCEWGNNKDTPKKFKDFQELIQTSSDNFWYNLNNWYIELSFITDDTLDSLTYKDIVRVEDIVKEFWIEF